MLNILVQNTMFKMATLYLQKWRLTLSETDLLLDL